MDVETEKVPNTLAAGIKATGGEGEAKATPHDDRERANRIPIWVVEEGVGGGLPPERTYSHSSLGPPVGYVVMPAGMHADRYADHIRFDMDPQKPGACGVLLASLSTRRAVEAAIAGEFGLSWRPGESSAPSQGGGAGDEATETIERLRAERDVLKADLARAESFAVSHEAWEACMVSHNPAWEPGGMAEFPRLVQPLWDAALGLQGRRNRVLEGARQAGRVGSAGDLEHAWEAVRGLAGLDPDSKAEGVEPPG
jgi:hypothetical protein